MYRPSLSIILSILSVLSTTSLYVAISMYVYVRQLVRGTIIGHRHWQVPTSIVFLQHKYTQAYEPLYNRCFIRQCQTAGEGDQNKELNIQAIVVSIGNHTSLSTALIVTISLQLVTLFDSAADLLAIASARQLSILTCCLSATTLTKNLSYCDALLCTN